MPILKDDLLEVLSTALTTAGGSAVTFLAHSKAPQVDVAHALRPAHLRYGIVEPISERSLSNAAALAYLTTETRVTWLIEFKREPPLDGGDASPIKRLVYLNPVDSERGVFVADYLNTDSVGGIEVKYAPWESYINLGVRLFARGAGAPLTAVRAWYNPTRNEVQQAGLNSVMYALWESDTADVIDQIFESVE